jgi:ABC-type bacteriocin/lantibiotic exporter with double-glycine peptidase domain
MEHNAMLRAMESGGCLTGQLDGMQRGLLSKIERRTRFTLVARTVMAACFGFGYLLAFIWGGLQLRDGVITFGIMTAFLQLVAQIQHPILEMLNMIPQLIHASASIDRIEELEEKEAESEHASVLLLSGKVGVHVQGVTFKYPKGKRYIIHDFTHDFKPGSRTALMGETGAGKTTLFRVMLSLIRPQQGCVELYHEGERVPLSVETRRNFVFVPQGNTLMSGTIRYNLQLAKPDATDEELQQVLHTACAEFVNDLPDGIDTELGERGSGLSEGQAQRIAIARGLLRPAQILLLDEISSSLDEPTECELYRRLFAAYPTHTMLFITHRSTVTALCNETIHL